MNDDTKFIKTLIIAASTITLIIIIVASITIYVKKQNRTKQLNDLTQTVQNALHKADFLCQNFNYQDALQTTTNAQQTFLNHKFAYKCPQFQQQLEQSVNDIKQQQKTHQIQLQQGWSLYKGQFLSPQQKQNQIQHEQHLAKLAEEKRKQEELQKQKELEDKLPKRYKPGTDMLYGSRDDLFFGVEVRGGIGFVLWVTVNNDGNTPKQVYYKDLFLVDEQQQRAFVPQKCSKIAEDYPCVYCTLNPDQTEKFVLEYGEMKKGKYLFPVRFIEKGKIDAIVIEYD